MTIKSPELIDKVRGSACALCLVLCVVLSASLLWRVGRAAVLDIGRRTIESEFLRFSIRSDQGLLVPLPCRRFCCPCLLHGTYLLFLLRVFICSASSHILRGGVAILPVSTRFSPEHGLQYAKRSQFAHFGMSENLIARNASNEGESFHISWNIFSRRLPHSVGTWTHGVTMP